LSNCNPDVHLGESGSTGFAWGSKGKKSFLQVFYYLQDIGHLTDMRIRVSNTVSLVTLRTCERTRQYEAIQQPGLCRISKPTL
jgi:hypothetical protein